MPLLSNELCPFCHRSETLKHLLWDCSVARSCWRVVQDRHSVLLRGQFHWRAALLGHSRSLVLSHILGVWDCIQISSLFTIWKLHCKYGFSVEVSSVNSFCHYWREEVCMKLSAKGYLRIKDVKEFSTVSYSESIAAFVSLRKRIWFHILYTPSGFLFGFLFFSCYVNFSEVIYEVFFKKHVHLFGDL